MKHAYYNEHDPYAAQWLRNLIAAGHIAPGDVDERSIVDVRADDVRGYSQCHWFAGVGGWSIALRLAGWPDDRPVWTGSCPCQPFSAAGAGKAGDDERHLWPAWFPLIRECKPAIVFGEQVEAAIGWGWLDVVFADLEKEGYACGATVLPACSVGAPHIRQRLWFVGYAARTGFSRDARTGIGSQTSGKSEGVNGWYFRNDPCDTGPTRVVADSPIQGRRTQPQRPAGANGRTPQESGRLRDVGFWSDAEWLPCADGKARPVGPGSFPLGHGIPNRASKLRAYGNAIVPQVAAEFIAAAKEAIAP